MKPTSRNVIRKVFELYFQGDSHQTIATKLDLPRPTVSDILSLLPESISPLRELAVDIQKQDLTVYEVKKGAELRNRLDDLGVSFDRVESFVESAEKSTDPRYAPALVVQAKMKLNSLEKESGKPYAETLTEFEKLKDDNKTLKAEKHELIDDVNALDAERKRKLAEGNVTEKELAHIVDIRRNLSKYRLNLSDTENIRKCLENIKETGGDPRAFVEYTKLHGSLKMRTSSLKKEEQEHASNLERLKEKEATVQSAIDARMHEKSQLDMQINEGREKLLAVRQETEEAQQKQRQELERLGQILNVEAEAAKINEALAVKQGESRRLDAEISQKQKRNHSLHQIGLEKENKNRNLESEIQAKLRINDYSTELLSAVAAQEQKSIVLKKEENGKRERLALADTITDFLTRQPSYDYNRFYSQVQLIKKRRETRTAQPGLNVSAVEEETRLLALKAFQGDLVSKKDHNTVVEEKQKSDRAHRDAEMKVKQLESGLQKTNERAESTAKENQLLQTLKANFEGRTVTLGELRNWVAKAFNEEIEKRRNDKFIAIGAGAYGMLEFFFNKITNTNNTPAKGDQR